MFEGSIKGQGIFVDQGACLRSQFIEERARHFGGNRKRARTRSCLCVVMDVWRKGCDQLSHTRYVFGVESRTLCRIQVSLLVVLSAREWRDRWCGRKGEVLDEDDVLAEQAVL